MVKSLDQNKQSSSLNSERVCKSAAASSSSCKYKGVRKRKWGKYVSVIRLPNSRERIWLGSYDTAEKAARAFDAGLFSASGGRKAKFNFPDNPPEIPNGRSLSPGEIQDTAARFAQSARTDQPINNSNSQSDSLSSQSVESPSTSVSDGDGQLEIEFSEIPLDNAFFDRFLAVAKRK